MSSITSLRWSAALVCAILVAACGQPGTSITGATPPPSAMSTPSPVPSATLAAIASVEPTLEPTLEPTAPPPTEEPPPVSTLAPIDSECPQDDLDDVISVQEYVDAQTSCFRFGVRVRGWLDTPPPLGFEPPLVKPSWIYYPSGDSATSLWHQPPPGEDHVCASGEDCWWFFPHPDPDLDLDLEPLQRWVILTGHTRDPRAQNCHYDGVGPNPNPELVTLCGRQLVVTAIEEDS
jgi:hypothetical protein